MLKDEIGMILIHLSPLAIIWTGATVFDWVVCAALYVIRMFFVTGGYHRYFSHRSYKTSRAFQFFLAFMAQTSVQKGVLWWASHHRDHHRHSDMPKDPHSNKIYGFFYAHIGWIVGPDYKETLYGRVKDFAKFAELYWLNKYYLVPPIVLGTIVFAIGGVVNGGGWAYIFSAYGLSTLVVGFFTSTVILFHGTFSINSLMHMIGKQRYATGDESRNSLILALITLGEGWHNNHHYYMSATRQGFFWWEIDITYYILRLLSFFGLIWQLNKVPKHIKYPKDMEEKPKRAASSIIH